MRQAVEGAIARAAGWVLSRLTGGALPPFAAASAIIEQNGEILVVERSDGLGLNLPGGFLRWQERLEDGLRREVLEETGFYIAPGRLVGIYSGPAPKQRLSTVVVAFEAFVVGGSLRDSYEGRALWLPVDDVLGRLALGNDIMLRDYLSPKVLVSLAR